MDQIDAYAFLSKWRCGTYYSSAPFVFEYDYPTPDGGRNWTGWQAAGNENFVDAAAGWRLAADPDAPAMRLQQTVDGGRTWSPIKIVNWQSAQFDFVDAQVGRTLVSDGTNTALVRTLDGGQTWAEIRPELAHP